MDYSLLGAPQNLTLASLGQNQRVADIRRTYSYRSCRTAFGHLFPWFQGQNVDYEPSYIGNQNLVKIVGKLKQVATSTAAEMGKSKYI